MTALTARAPLHHLPMNMTQRPARRLSARLQEKEDLPPPSTTTSTNGYNHATTTQQISSKLPAAQASNSSATSNVRKAAAEKEKTNGARKRKIGYDEEIEGFPFTRARSKKPRDSVVAKAPPQPPVIPEERSRPEEEAIVTEQINGIIAPEKPKRRNKMSFSTPKALVKEKPTAKRRSKRLSGETDEQSDREPSPGLKVKKRSKERRVEKESQDQIEAAQDRQNRDLPTEEDEHSATKIALPFADTPVIRRNKAMREGKADKGERRSSLGMRGRRASSLIDSGTSNALPHQEVDIEDFYKHIESAGLSEPRRMRQLLTWCATRAMGEKRSGAEFEDQSARLAARVIQEELLADLSNRSELSDWFSREDAPPPEIPVVHKPNPKNVQNQAKIVELEEQIKRLQSERKALEALLRPPSIPPLSTITSKPASSSVPSQPASRKTTLDTNLLSSSDLQILETLTSHGDSTTSPASLSARVNAITASLRPTVEAFADGVHQMSAYRDTADRVAGTALGICARRLEDRDQRITGRSDGEKDSEAKDRGPGRANDDIGRLLRGLSRIDR